LPVFSPEVLLITTREECVAHVPRRGIQYLGLLNHDTGKLEALAQEDLIAVERGYDLVLMEADGSRGLPCKGWTETDPVIPVFATHTLGVVSINAIGLPASEENVFRLDEFLALTGLRRGARITGEALAAMVGAPDGMFRRSAGMRALIINQAESCHGLSLASSLADMIRASYVDTPRVILAGSALKNEWVAL
jgi:probable selenium-dependent hydroxylase accessory protein YqeC